MALRTYITLKDSSLKAFLSDKIVLTQNEGTMSAQEKEMQFIINVYRKFSTTTFVGLITLIYIDENSDIALHPDFIDITDNPKYSLSNILLGNVHRVNMVIDGSNEALKKSVLKNLAQEGILCQERAMREVCNTMKPGMPIIDRLAVLSKFLHKYTCRKLVFLYYSDSVELLNKIAERGMIFERDKEAAIFQNLYLETCRKLMDMQNLYLVDCSKKKEEEIISEVRAIIES